MPYSQVTRGEPHETKTITLTLLLATQASSAMIAPWYTQLRVFDAVVLSFANEANLEQDETMDDVEISSIEKLENDNYAIANENTRCIYSIKANMPPPGAVGVPGYSAIKESCETDTETRKIAKSYEDISEKLRQAAKFQKMVKKALVTKKNTIRLSYKK